MKPNKDTSVSIVYQCTSDITTRNREKFISRMCRAIEDMAEDGFTNLVINIDKKMPIVGAIIQAAKQAKSTNAQVTLTLVLPYNEHSQCKKTSHIYYDDYCADADYIIYSRGEDGLHSMSAQRILARSSALIIYCEDDSPRLNELTLKAQKYRLPYININV